MNETNFVTAVNGLTMPETMRAELLNGCQTKQRTKNFFFRYSKLITVAATAAVLILTASIPSYAAYDLYQTKNVNVFFEEGVSQEEIDAVGDALRAMGGVSSVEFITADEAWNTFSAEYLPEDLAASFTENPLADSFNYHVTISLTADTEEIRERIEQLHGVRHTSDLYELKKTDPQPK